MQNFVHAAMRCRVADTMHPMALCSRRIMCFSAATVLKSPQLERGVGQGQEGTSKFFEIEWVNTFCTMWEAQLELS